jgi:hypothetical protein
LEKGFGVLLSSEDYLLWMYAWLPPFGADWTIMVEHTPDGALIQEGRQIQVDFSGDKNMIAVNAAVKSWGYDLGKIFDLILGRHDHVCSRWLCFSFDNYGRKPLPNTSKLPADI